MSDPLQALLQPNALKLTLFPPNSRYHGIDIATLTRVDGPPLAYLRRRIVPPPERFAVLQEYTVVSGDRLDNISGQYLGDPELFWRICDANRVLRPEELTETPGRRLRITLPEGIPGASNA
jgi:nucleoid-associated protein YgaU